MIKTWLPTFNFIIILILLSLGCGLQTTFWFQAFGDFPAPQIWLIFIIYLSLYRRPLPAILSIYAMGLCATSFSGMPLKMMFTSCLLLFSLIYLVKNRIFWTGVGYYTMMCIFGSLSYHIIYLLLSQFLENNPTPLLFVTRLLESILTPLFGYILYFPLSYLDRLTIDNVTTESGGLQI